ncbi:hypothetical protein LWC34_08845 [Kibdelosporangium philippinense]|uniref:Uncharacterized protein n=1 Tax=Kibdelosporangium philippinense TaxID=211113 RepID=A0ABS8Z812_9PSEU|nr:hypothetical protein [Kibdelosporangium philippinense]MCE7002935.1 hypothetical protein [Kibdelosporangium philippinense]
MSQTARPQPVTGARVCSIISFVLSAIAILFLPIVFGLAAIVLTVVGFAMGDKVLGKWAIPVAVVATALGFFLGYLAMS